MTATPRLSPTAASGLRYRDLIASMFTLLRQERLLQTRGLLALMMFAAFNIFWSALVLPLSFSGGAIATPAIGRALGGNATSLGWITNAFMLGFGSCLMAAGALRR